MIEEIRAVPLGRPAGEALAVAVADVKERAGPLASVTVVVASNFAGLSARRLLASGTAGGRGVANVQFVTPFRLAEILSGDLLYDRRPITNPVLGAAVRRVLAEEPGPFTEVASHHATETGLTSLYGELSHVSEVTLGALEGAGGSAAVAVITYRRIAARLGGFHGEDDIAQAAAERPSLQTALDPLGHLIWYLPEPVTPALARLLGAVLHAAPSDVIVGVTGAADSDEAVLAACHQVGVEVPAGEIDGIEPPAGSHIVSITDADEEVRAVVRRIVGLAEEGVRLDRIGVFHPVPDPYVHTLQQQLAGAGIPANGPSWERLLDSVAGRTLLGALALPGERWRRGRVMALVAGGPVRHGEERTFPTSWERLSRQAGVVQDLGDWRRKLGAHSDALGHRIASIDDPEERASFVAYLERERDDAIALADFVDDLAASVGAVDAARDWVAKADAARRLLHQLLGAEHRRQGWPEREQIAATRVEDALTRLAALDELEPDPSPDGFRRALTAELGVTRGRVGRFGDGVVYGPLHSAVGQDLDAVFIVGLTEGQCPAPRRDNALLPDDVRALAADGELPLRASRMADQHRHFLAALAAAPPDRRYLTFPRGDLRGGRHQLPSRWLLDTASALAGHIVYGTDFAALGAPVVDVVASYRAGVRSPATARVSLLDRDLAAIAAHVDAGGDPAQHPAADSPAERRGFAAITARRSAGFTEWDGNLEGLPVPSPASGELLSASRLETWAACGFRYFLGSVLGLGDRDDPERIVEISALDRGKGLHSILEAFFQEVIDAGPHAPATAWTDAHRARLQAIAAAGFDELERTGRTGRTLHWRLERQRLAILLDDFLTADDDHRAATGATPARVELPFGMKGAPPVEIDLPDGRTIRFRGMADRVDVTADGRHLVSDYKSGKGGEYDKLAVDDPTKAGTTLQLGLYSEAAVQLLGAAAAEAHYWMVNEDVPFPRRGYPWDAERRRRFVEVVGGIVDGIERGMFAAVPGEWDSWRNTHGNCTYCDFDDVCLRDRGEIAEAKAAAPELAVRDILDPTAEAEP